MFIPLQPVKRRAEADRGAAHALQEREESFRLLFANNPQPMWVYDRETLAFLEVNDAAVRRYGYTREEFLSMRLTDIRPEEEVPRLIEVVKNRFDGMLADNSYRHRRKDGSIIDVEIDSHSLEFGKRRAVLVMARDVTERREIERVVQEEAERRAAIIAVQQAVATADLDLDAITRLIVERTQELTRASGAVLEAVEGDKMVYRGVSGSATPYLGFRLSTTDSLSGLCARTGEVLRCDNSEEDPRVDLAACRRIGIRSMIIVPLRHGHDVIGTLKVVSDRPHAFTDQDADTLAVMAGLLAAALARAAEFAAKQASEERFRVIFEQAGIGINLSDGGGRLLTSNPAFGAMLGYSADELQGLHFGEITHPDDVGADAELFQQLVRGMRDAYQIEKRYLHKSGQQRWVLLTVTVVRGADGELLNTVAMAEDISERKAYEEQLHYQASHDALTGLPNRLLLQDRLEQAILTATREMRPASLLLLDMDRFKEINDTYGHHVGDLFLQELALRLTSVLRDSDTVARLGGDEFAIVLPRANEEGALHVVKKIRAILRKPFILEGQQLNFGASMGIALCPEHGKDAHTLLRRADVAMYVAKRMQRGYALYAPEQDTYSPERLQIMSDLRHAIEQGELLLHFQPVVHLVSGVVQDVEALVRWRHTERGLIPPSQFIGLAEETGLIEPMTLWVLEAAVEQCRHWHRAGIELNVAVNLSARNMHDLSLADVIIAMLHEKDVQPSQLTVEITESALMADMEQAGALLAQLHSAGVRIAIDDFGTGYSSLGRLKDLPVDEIKIDRSFVMNMTKANAAIVRSIIELGHNLGLRVVAEGVEDQNTWDALRLMRCDLAQGYFLSRPLPIEEMTGWHSSAESVQTAG